MKFSLHLLLNDKSLHNTIKLNQVKSLSLWKRPRLGRLSSPQQNKNSTYSGPLNMNLNTDCNLYTRLLRIHNKTTLLFSHPPTPSILLWIKYSHYFLLILRILNKRLYFISHLKILFNLPLLPNSTLLKQNLFNLSSRNQQASRLKNNLPLTLNSTQLL